MALTNAANGYLSAIRNSQLAHLQEDNMNTPHSRFQQIWRPLLVLIMLLSSVLAVMPQSVHAAPPTRPAAVTDATLSIVEVAAPDINCIFDADCRITVDDLASHFLPPAASGDAFLQSRLWPIGEKGTVGAGLYPYLYRIDLRNARGITAAACVTTMTIDFGPISSLDYNRDGKADQIFVISKGGLGNIKPAAAVQSGDIITFRFDPAICVGGRSGDSSFFFGLASTQPAETVPARLTGTIGLDNTLRAKAPQHRPAADIAYIHDSDTTSAAAFQALLNNEGYSVQLVHMNDVLNTNFGEFKLVIIGDDTGKLDSWHSNVIGAEHVARGGVPIIGVGEGGYAYFGQLNMQIGWGNGWHGSQKEVIGDATQPYFQFPYDLTPLLPGPLALYNEPTNEVGIHLPAPIAGVTPLGREPNDRTHYPLVAERFANVCHQIWGFSGNPRYMNGNGQQLFANAVRYGLNNCPPARREPVVEDPKLPIFNPEEQVNVEILQADNTIFAAELHLPKAQLQPVKGPDGTQYMEMALPGVDMDGSIPGQPGVPIVHRIVAIPEGAEVVLSDVEVRASKYMTDVIIYPSQPSPADVMQAQEPVGDEKPSDEMPDPKDFMDAPFTIDEKAYSSEESFPRQVVSVQPLGKMRDLNVVQLSIAAGQFNPAKRTLKLFDKVQLAVKFEGGQGGFLPREQMDNPFDNHANPMYELALNYEIVRRWPFPGDIVSRICWGHEYLVITDPAFRSAADTLRTWKIQKGISTLVVETGNDANDAGTTPAQIQSYIRNKFNNCIIRPSYVLLLGDAEHIAPFYRTTHYGDSAGTDLDYALMNNIDILPDLAIGRIPVDTLDQANTVIDKIVGYEKTPPFSHSFYSNLSFAAYFQCCRTSVADDGRTVRSFIETAELVRDELTSLGYSVERIYSTSTAYHPDYAAAGRDTTPRKYRNGAALPAAIDPGSGFSWNGSSTDVINAINEGRFLMFHRDHGGVNGWSSPSFRNSHLNSLTNTSKLPVVYSVNCASGLFDNETLNPAAQGWNYNTSVNNSYWAENILRMEGGAVGVIGDTRNSPTWANSALSRGLFDATWPGVVPEGGATSIRRLGDILNYGKSYLAGQVGVAQTAGSVSQNEANTDIILYHVYGDPTMQMWTSNPWFIKLPKLYEIEKFDPTIWELRYPVEGAIITLLQEGNPVARATVRNGSVKMPILLKEFDADKGFDLSANLPGGMSTLLESSRSSGNVTPELGGILQDELGRIKVQFPAGSVKETTTILLTDVEADEMDETQLRRFVLEGMDEDGEVVDTFDAAYSMELHYTDEELAAAGLDESSLRCTWLDETTSEWQPVASTVDTVNNIVTCQIDHFTEFALSGDKSVGEPPVEMNNHVFLPIVVK